ncbi:hypothetical protein METBISCDRAFT_28794 [Metschnikowia bicuspidata]|uniref:Uncharacterized protein n=1 Tax=Metschnikowia bicuspidata TaxID=27322 RepID=A0A4P9Z917_9ASCO|nr:hypothetical protein METBISCDRAFT_28794 [Metschnikowia bicuspidata]
MTSSASIILLIVSSFVALAQAAVPFWDGWRLDITTRRISPGCMTETYTVNGLDRNILLIGLPSSIKRGWTKHYWTTAMMSGESNGTQTMVSQLPSGTFAL